MNAENILANIDFLLKESRLDEAESYMKAALEEAKDADRTDIMLTLYNELAGFTVTAADFPKRLKAAAARRSFLKK